MLAPDDRDLACSKDTAGKFVSVMAPAARKASRHVPSSRAMCGAIPLRHVLLVAAALLTPACVQERGAEADAAPAADAAVVAADAAVPADAAPAPDDGRLACRAIDAELGFYASPRPIEEPARGIACVGRNGENLRHAWLEAIGDDYDHYYDPQRYEVRGRVVDGGAGRPAQGCDEAGRAWNFSPPERWSDPWWLLVESDEGDRWTIAFGGLPRPPAREGDPVELTATTYERLWSGLDEGGGSLTLRHASGTWHYTDNPLHSPAHGYGGALDLEDPLSFISDLGLPGVVSGFVWSCDLELGPTDACVLLGVDVQVDVGGERGVVRSGGAASVGGALFANGGLATQRRESYCGDAGDPGGWFAAFLPAR